MQSIQKIREIKDHLFSIRFFRYCFCGGISAIIDTSIFFVLNELFNIYYLFALFVSFTVAVTVNYSLQRKITFKNTYSKKHKQFTVFVLLQLIGLLISGVIIAAMVEIFSVWPTLARFITIWIVLAYTYTSNKVITFNKMKGEKDA
jgi:putative flippase GtrA